MGKKAEIWTHTQSGYRQTGDRKTGHKDDHASQSCRMHNQLDRYSYKTSFHKTSRHETPSHKTSRLQNVLAYKTSRLQNVRVYKTSLPTKHPSITLGLYINTFTFIIYSRLCLEFIYVHIHLYIYLLQGALRCIKLHKMQYINNVIKMIIIIIIVII